MQTPQNPALTLPPHLRRLAAMAGQDPAAYLAGLLALHGNATAAAAALFISSRTFYDWCKRVERMQQGVAS